MTKYHVNQETGRAGQCRATKKGCPLGADTPHFQSKEEANLYIEKIAKESHKTFNKLNKNTNEKRIRPNPEDYFPKGELPQTYKIYENDPKKYFDGQYNSYKEILEARGEIARSKPEWMRWQENNPGKALLPDEASPKRVKIYRSGELTPGNYNGETALYADEADYHRPDDAAPRHGSLYASTDGVGLRRWLRGNSMSHKDLKFVEPFEMEVNANEVRVYHIPTWEKVSWGKTPPKEYWDSGMVLSRFLKVAKEEGWDTSEWEVLAPTNSIIKSKPLTSPAVIKIIKEKRNGGDHDSDDFNEYAEEEIKNIMKNINKWRKFK